jgi:hypothetical protein
MSRLPDLEVGWRTDWVKNMVHSEGSHGKESHASWIPCRRHMWPVDRRHGRGARRHREPCSRWPGCQGDRRERCPEPVKGRSQIGPAPAAGACRPPAATIAA